MDKENLALTDEEEEDEEMMLIIFPALYLTSSRLRKMPCHTSKLTGADYISELLNGHPRRCFNNLRVEPHIFQLLSDHLRSKNLLKNTRGVTVEEQIGMFMYMLSRNASFGALTDIFQHSPETLHMHLTSCFSAIKSLTSEIIKPPSTKCHWKISSNPHFWPYFENCIGVIDGIHVPITISRSEAAPYQNRGKDKAIANTTARKRSRDGSVGVEAHIDALQRTDGLGWRSLEVESERDEEENTVHSCQRQEDIGRSFGYDDPLDDEEHDAEHQVENGEHASASHRAHASHRRKSKKHGAPTTCVEETMSAFVDLKREQLRSKKQASEEGKQYSISRCFEVLHSMDLSDEIKVLASDVLKDALNREIFLCYEAGLCGLWLKKEVDKLGHSNA